jgi:hypothetical protein
VSAPAFSFKLMKNQNAYRAWLLAGLAAGLAWTGAARGGEANVTLNGVAAVFGTRVALFKTQLDEPFSLMEGESRSGIKLLAIDFSAGSVRVECEGKQTTLRICQAPKLTAEQVVAGAVVAAGAEVTGGGQGNDLTGANAVGTSGIQGGVGTAGAGGGGAGGQKSDPNLPAVEENPAVANAGKSSQTSSQVYQWWTKEAEKIEAARMATAARVLAGEWPPYPRTPLTPVNTPPPLVSADSVFMEHGPGMVVSAP